MKIINNFKISQKLYENDSTLIYRAVRLADKKNVIIKELKHSHRNEYKINQFINEAEILSLLNQQSIIKVFDVFSQPSFYYHVLEDIGGESLYDLLFHYTFSIEESLNIALLSMKALRYLHQNNIIHADVTPQNIIYNVNTRALQIIDFGLSIRNDDLMLMDEQRLHSSGNLFYISPEQTGHIAHHVDNRSDIYSLGMTLYHLFLTKAPLQATNHYELLHKQVALTPPSLSQVDEHIPKVISAIIDKMISKNPAKRYQSDKAVISDIQICLNNRDIFDNIPYFQIASLDKPILNIGETLFGREKEMIILKNALSKSDEQALRILISGETGTGKTKLITTALTSYIDTDRFNILIGKFDTFAGYLPYSGYRQIFAHLNKIISPQSMQVSLKKMHQDTPKVLNMFFPGLENIFNTKLKRVASNEFFYTKNQLYFAINDFFTYIATKETPLIIFFDDIQWIDQASSSLLQSSVLNSNNPNLHFIATIRNDENKESPYLLNIKKTLHEDTKRTLVDIKLTNLSQNSIKEMIQNTFSKSETSSHKLTNIILKKTDGNPFYIKTFLEFLLQNNELRFAKGEWKYSLAKIKTYKQSDNIIELVRAKFNQLNSVEKSYLQYLAILGNNFELFLALKIMKHYGYDTKLIQSIIKHGFIEIHTGIYKFTHDTLLQDVFESLSKESKYKIHKNIGLFLERQYNNHEYHNIIIVAYHLNRAYPIGKLPRRLFKFNIMSIKEMLNVNSYMLALSKIEWIDTTFFHDSLWSSEHTLTFEYSFLKTKAFYMNSNFKKANEHIYFLIDKCITLKERLLCFKLLKDISVTEGKNFQKTIIFGNQLFHELKVEIPQDNTTLILTNKELLKSMHKHPLFDNPHYVLTHKKVKSRHFQNICSLIVEYTEIAYYLTDVELMKWCYLSLINISFKHGNSSESAFGYALYGSYLVSQKQYKKAQMFAEIALKLNAMFKDVKMLPKIYNLVANFINPYTKHLQSNVKLYNKSLIQSKINGDLVFGTWANFLMHFSDFLSGNSLINLQNSITNQSDFILYSGDVKMIAIFNVLKSTLQQYQNQNIDTTKKDKKSLKVWEKESFYPALAWYAIIKASYCFINNDIDAGIELLKKHVHSQLNEVIMFPKINLHVIRALLLLQKSQELDEIQIELLEDDLSIIQDYYKSSPATFRFYKLLFDAETHKDKETIWDAAKKYDKAIQEAKKKKNSLFTLLATLCASRFWKKLNYTDMYTLYLNETVVACNQWGAYSISKKLKATINKTEEKFSSQLKNMSAHMNSESRTEQSNFQTLMQTYNAISQSKNTQELISTFMKILLQNATASSGVFILKEGEDFFVRAKMDYSQDSFKLLHEKLHQQTYLPNDVIQSVINTGENIILNYPSQNGNFQFDSYFKNNTLASSLAIAIKLEGKVSGILYIQNNEVITILEEESIRTLEMILTQVAIVFNNIMLYETLQVKDKNLNKAQELLHVGSWSFNSSSQEIICSDETYRIFEIKQGVPMNYSLFLSLVHSDDLQYLTKAHQEAIKNESVYSVEHRIVTAKGNIKHVIQKAEIYIEEGIEKMSGTIQDITQSYLVQKQLDTISKVMEQSPNSIVITNTLGKIEYVNEAFTTLTGYSKNEVLDSDMDILNSKKHFPPFYEELWNTILIKKEIWTGMITNRIKNNKLIDLKTTIFPILDSQNEPVKFAAIQEDVTEKNIKDKLFLIQTRQAQMGEMISMIAHQWRQPLSAIASTSIGLKMGMELNRYNLDTKEGQEAQKTHFLQQLKKIEEFVLNLSTTIDDFRNFHKPNKKPIITTIKALILKSLNIIHTSLKNNNIEIIEDHTSPEDIEMYDSEMIQVILNILKNSQDAFLEHPTKDAFIKITTNKKTISICDNAGGIPEEILDNIFEVYFSTKSEKNGTGLGLHMVKTIIERHHNGTIEVANTDNGACFTIVLDTAAHDSLSL